jgi:hypothetical protein
VPPTYRWWFRVRRGRHGRRRALPAQASRARSRTCRSGRSDRAYQRPSFQSPPGRCQSGWHTRRLPSQSRHRRRFRSVGVRCDFRRAPAALRGPGMVPADLGFFARWGWMSVLQPGPRPLDTEPLLVKVATAKVQPILAHLDEAAEVGRPCGGTRRASSSLPTWDATERLSFASISPRGNLRNRSQMATGTRRPWRQSGRRDGPLR